MHAGQVNQPDYRSPQFDDEREHIHRLLDTLHDAASKAHFDRYFACYRDDAIFLGTDASERWTVSQFKDYAKPIFDAGNGWLYVPKQRKTEIVSDSIAVFDEIPVSAKYGECRGTGVAMKNESAIPNDEFGGWRVRQYSLTFLVPNDLAGDITARIKAGAK